MSAPSQEVTVPQDREASAPNTLETDELPLAEMKPAAKKRSHRRKPTAEDVPLKKKKQQVPSGKEPKASMFEDKSNF